MVSKEEWLAQKAEQKKRLYSQYGKRFEQDHKGKYLAISEDGQTILGDRMGEVLHEAVDAFGPDNFAMARVGYLTLVEWPNIRA